MNVIILHRSDPQALPIYLNTANICAWGPCKKNNVPAVDDCYVSWIAVHDPNKQDYYVRETTEEILNLISHAETTKKVGG